MQSLCTLRDHCRHGSRNTRYQAGAAPYLDRSSTGWIAPACLAHSFDHLVGGRAASAGPQTNSNDLTRLGRPADAEVDPETNKVFIADGYFNHRVIVFDANTGAYKRHWGAYGKKPTDEKMPPYNPAAAPSPQFGNPVHCVKIAKDGLVYICDRANDRIHVFRKDGTFVKEFIVEKNTLRAGSVWDLDFWIDPKQTYLFNADGTNNEVRTSGKGRNRPPAELIADAILWKLQSL
jgi:hypothetical protein